MKKLNKKNITKLLIEIQDHGNLIANSIATRAVEEFALQKEHQKQTGNPASAYATRGVQKRKSHYFDGIKTNKLEDRA